MSSVPDLFALFPPALQPLATAGLIFMARIIDVSMGTLRILFLSRGHRALATVLAFFEALVWLIAIRQIFANLTHVSAYLAYASGFATGTYVGMLIEAKLALGLLAVRIITREDASELATALNRSDYGVTAVTAKGTSGRVRLLFSIIRRRELDRVMDIVQRLHPKAFVSISDVRMANEGIFPRRSTPYHLFRRLGLARRK